MKNFWQNKNGFVFLMLWICLLSGGFGALWSYANTAGAHADAPLSWPKNSQLRVDPQLPSLLIFAHPRCPCSQASIAELERLLPRIQGKAQIHIVFVKPTDVTEDWTQEALWEQAWAMPGVLTSLDAGGLEADRFGAKTSGQTFLYDKKGELVFSGGITPERGHMGESEGKNAILDFVENGRVKVRSSPVFGCALKNPERANLWKDSHEHQHEHQ